MVGKNDTREERYETMKITNGIYAAILALAATAAHAEEHGGDTSDTASQDGMQMDGMSKDGSSYGMGMMGQSGMGGSMMPGMMIAMMDTDDNGALSLEEVQAVHERMFNMADSDDDGQVTVEEMRSMMGGGMMSDGMMSDGMTQQNSQ